jgi:hypothetical protein
MLGRGHREHFTISVDQFGYRQQLRRALTLGDLIIFGMIFMVPIAPAPAG